jgi:ATP-binding cassette subfamily B protein
MNNSLAKKSLYQVTKKNRVLVALLIFAVLGVVVISLIPPQILKLIIDNNLVPKNKNGLLRWAIVYLAVLLFIGVFDFLKEAILTILGQKITKEIRTEMMCKLGKVNSRFFSSQETGIVVSRFTNDVDAINALLPAA